MRCSHVENGVIRVASQPKYPNCLGTGARVRKALGNFARQLKAVTLQEVDPVAFWKV
jgi:hypothetical protein